MEEFQGIGWSADEGNQSKLQLIISRRMFFILLSVWLQSIVLQWVFYLFYTLKKDEIIEKGKIELLIE